MRERRKKEGSFGVVERERGKRVRNEEKWTKIKNKKNVRKERKKMARGLAPYVEAHRRQC